MACFKKGGTELQTFYCITCSLLAIQRTRSNALFVPLCAVQCHALFNSEQHKISITYPLVKYIVVRRQKTHIEFRHIPTLRICSCRAKLILFKPESVFVPLKMSLLAIKNMERFFCLWFCVVPPKISSAPCCQML